MRLSFPPYGQSPLEENGVFVTACMRIDDIESISKIIYVFCHEFVAPWQYLITSMGFLSFWAAETAQISSL
jgi:hypothetical protein